MSLPEWLAGRTKIIFGPLFLAGLAIAASFLVERRTLNHSNRFGRLPNSG